VTEDRSTATDFLSSWLTKHNKDGYISTLFKLAD